LKLKLTILIIDILQFFGLYPDNTKVYYQGERTMKSFESHPIAHHFGNIKDPRSSNKRHNLSDIIVITISAVIAGAESWENIEEFGKAKNDWLSGVLELPHGIPSHDTISRVFAMIDPAEFRESFAGWIQAVSDIALGEVVPIDGKTLRRSYDKDSDKAAIHMVSAWASANGIVLGQVKTDAKSNEITAIPELLNMLKINGCIITIDAMGCQKKIAEKIADKDADYILALKENQKNLHDDVELFFQENSKNDFKEIDSDYYETVNGEHGRIEVRKYRTTSDIDWLCGKECWKNIQSIAMVERERHIGDAVSGETSYYISSLASDAEMIGGAVRKHWGIENSLHWVLDVTFREDDCRIRKGNSPENFAVLRHIALNLLKKEKSKISVKAKRLKSAWDNDYLAKVMGLPT